MFNFENLTERIFGVISVCAICLGIGFMTGYLVKRKSCEWEKQITKIEAQKALIDSNQKVREVEKNLAVSINDQSKIERMAKSEQKKHATVVSKLRSGYGLRVSIDKNAGVSRLSDDAADSNGSHETSATGFLGEADAAFLIAEADRANAVVIQLTHCQDVLQKTFNALSYPLDLDYLRISTSGRIASGLNTTR